MNRRLRPAVAMSLSILLCLPGCVSFVPRYDPVLDEKTTSAYEEIAQFLAEIELGKYENKDSFADASDEYAEIQGLLSVAELRAATLPVGQRGTAAKARDQLVSFIQGCKTSITTLSSLHKRLGLIAGAGTGAGAQVKCDEAARAARAMKGG